MNKLYLLNINSNFINNILEELDNLSSIERLNTLIVLPNYSLLEEMRKLFLEKYGIIPTDNIITFDDVVENTTKNTDFISDEIQSLILEDFLADNYSLPINLIDEIKYYINLLRGHNIGMEIKGLKTKDIFFKEIIEIYIDYLECLERYNLRDFWTNYIETIKDNNIFSNKKIIIGGFIEFRPLEYKLIEKLSRHNKTSVYYPLKMARSDIKYQNIIDNFSHMGFKIEERINAEDDFEKLTYNMFSNDKFKYNVSPNLIETRTKYDQIILAFFEITKLLKNTDSNEITIIIPSSYEYLVKEIGHSLDISLDLLDNQSVMELPALKNLYIFLEHILNPSKDTLIEIIKNIDIFENIEVKDVLGEIRSLNYKEIESKKDISVSLISVLDIINKIKEEIINKDLYYLVELIYQNYRLEEIKKEDLLDNSHLNFITSIKVLEELIKDIKTFTNSYSIDIEEKLRILKDRIRNKTYYNPITENSIKVLKNINAIGVNTKYKFILGLEEDIQATDAQLFRNYKYHQEFESLNINLESREERIDNEIIKFVQSLGNSEIMYLLWNKNKGSVYPNTITELLKRIDKNNINISYMETENIYFKNSVPNSYFNISDINYKEQLTNNDICNDIDFVSYSTYMLDTYNKCPFKFLMKYYYRFIKYDQDELNDFYLQKNILYKEVLEEYNNTFEENCLSEDDVKEKIKLIVKNHSKNACDYFVRIISTNISEYILSSRRENEDLNLEFIPKYLNKTFYKKLGNRSIHGTIDRVDQSIDGKQMVVNFTSSSNKTNRAVLDLVDMKIPIYTILLQNSVGAYYGNVESISPGPIFILEDIYTNKRRGTRFNTTELSDFKKNIYKRTLEIIKKIESRFFDVDPIEEKACLYCDYKEVCRKEDILEI